MKREPVNSSTVTSVGWQPFEGDPQNGTLEVEFSSKGVYQYEGVPKETFESFMRSESKGHFFQVFVRPCFVTVRLHVKDCYQGSLYRATVGDKCPETCECWCHKQRKDVSDAQSKPKAEKDRAKKAGAKAKKPRPPV